MNLPKIEKLVYEVQVSVKCLLRWLSWSIAEMSDHYWQNDYHHLDVNTTKKDEHHSFYMSFIRRAARDLDLQGHCQIRPHKLLEVTLLYVANMFNGLLVLYEAEDINTGKTVTMETHLQWLKSYAVLKPEGPIGRLISLEVRYIGYRNSTMLQIYLFWQYSPSSPICIRWVHPVHLTNISSFWIAENMYPCHVNVIMLNTF